MIRRLGNESGQALAVSVVFIFVLIGGTALSIDVGSWYREHRQAQTTADAAALAAAQNLPTANTTDAMDSATTIAGKNGGGIDVVNGISFSSERTTGGTLDTVEVRVTRNAPGFFSKLFSIDSTNVHAKAAARSSLPAAVQDAAPIVVNISHQYLSGTDVAGNKCPCFGPGEPTTIPLGKNGAPGSFGIVDLTAFATSDKNGKCNQTPNGNAGSSTVGNWIVDGYSGMLQLGCYDSDPGASFNSGNIRSAMQVRKFSTLLFPVYDTEQNQGSNAPYHIIGWAAFYITGFKGTGNSGSVSGYFMNVIWDGIQSSTTPGSQPDLGVHSIALVN
jgi:Flp pilus assembly protein TadG